MTTAGQITRASTSYSGYQPADAFDGVDTTSWYAASGCEDACCVTAGEPWIEVEFTAAREARHVLIRGNRDSYPVGYDVLTGVIEVYRTDGGLTSVPFVTNRPDGDTLVNVNNSSAPVTGVRRVRLVMHGTETTSAPGIGELRVYGN